MSLRNLNSPPVVAIAGAAISIGLPMLEAALSSSASLSLLKSLNVVAFATNVIAVSVPGRLDGQLDEKMRAGELDPTKPNATASKSEDSPLVAGKEKSSVYTLNLSRTLINPSGWAFAIWGPIYLGEASFVAAQLFASDAATLALLPHITAPFVAANLFQSLWCASFRPSYGEGWKKYISVAMLAGTGYSLSLVHSAGSAVMAADPSSLSYLLLPMTVHFGWVSAATLVNLNGALASDESASPRSLIALGNSSALAATALGVGLTVSQSAPAYGLTLAWALAACADGMTKRIPSQSATEEETLAKAAGVQKNLCWAGSFACAVAAAYAGLS
mmetsp:Transcript_17667/g.38189  ORF Transcript_17667/g.38189 Transcript_17667/m.38189 type:complete len:331 (-) Transcript_17667:1279-2271(-)|eukprot:CAMPEP_0172316186 /NCGR_PEP_ID=MMETSP1058-20130122/27499_1 /TAXON_ID=83371 /ORGANISM="Detonula confervacea, Strain CCMP 353" /LENGTH=330 /DNA_ID=CAMNT_0013030443 /DNA_START=78 /DNA_END=1070 /DNA_ORIENTATION=+